MNKKGEITTQQIVLLIILIVSFVVILFFVFRLGIGKTSDSEVCHNSIVTRSAGVLPKESVPLNCKTQYICISKDGTCEKMTSPQIEKVQTTSEVYKVLADNMANCWWMFGEGNLNYIGDTFTSNLYCSICSQIGFDDSASSIFNKGIIDKKDFYTYLANTNASGKTITYLDYLNGLKTAATIEEGLKTTNAQFGTIDTTKQYYIVMGIFSKVGVAGWIAAGAVGVATGAGVIASVVFSGGLTIPVIIGAVAGGTGGYFLGTAVNGISGNPYLSPTIIEANSAAFNSLNCSSIKTLA
ncbi:Uncharacterised protein [uncultured archaeon]|nr:Uncharacterised protein [uncultured archaeon]